MKPTTTEQLPWLKNPAAVRDAASRYCGDPVRMAGALVTGHAAQIQQHAEMVRAFVQQGKDEAFAQGFPN